MSTRANTKFSLLRRTLGAVLGTLLVAASVTLTTTVLPGTQSSASATTPTVTCTSSADLFNTGYNSATGGYLTSGNDANWQVSGGYGGTSYSVTDTPTTPSINWPIQYPPGGATWAPAVVGNQAPGQWSNSPYGNANWIAQNTGNQSAGSSWYFKYDFNIDPSVDPTKFALNLNFLADNSVAEVWVNGVAQSSFSSQLPQADNADALQYVGYTLTNPTTGLSNAVQLDLNNSWQTGLNSIIVQVYSAPFNMGFDAQATSTVVCPVTSYTVQKSVDKTSAHFGDKVTYTVKVTNTGNTAVPYHGSADAAFIDDLSGVLDDATYDNDASGGGTFVYSASAKTLSWSTTSLAVGAVDTLTYSVTATGAGDHSLHNSVSVPSASSSIGSCAVTCSTTTPVLNTVTAKSDTASTGQGQPVTTTVDANDVSAITSLPLDPASVTIVTPPSNGTATPNTDGTITYTPNASFTGSDSYVYQICDTSSTPVCDTATVDVLVSAPVAGLLAFTGETGVAQTVEAAMGYVGIGLGLFVLALLLRRRLSRIPRH